MKNRRVSGPVNIAPLLIRHESGKLVEMSTALFERFLNGDNKPLEWKITFLTYINKKGKKRDPSNYRGISVICSIFRLYSKLLWIVLKEQIVEIILEEQAGFRAGIIYHIFTIKILSEKITQFADLHISFADIENACDSGPFITLWVVNDRQ